jgi:hypothetical protein
MEITFALTSCGRQDLLERTIDSFLEKNTYPIKKYLINEDSAIEGINDRLKQKYSYLDIEWIENKERMGQIWSIDNMYSKIKTKYIFHCEDDWLFTEKSFIEKSLEILENNPTILQVWLRDIQDLNGHPVVPCMPHYSIVSLDYLGVWNGFSFNPGLRRLADYKLVESYKKIGHEPQLSIKYKELGFISAVLNTKHVEHIGWNKHVTDITRTPI